VTAHLATLPPRRALRLPTVEVCCRYVRGESRPDEATAPERRHVQALTAIDGGRRLAYFELMFRTHVQDPSAIPAPRTGRSRVPETCEVAVLGGGIGGMATALRLQAAGLNTVVFEAHGIVGGCAGYYRRRGFSFDVGATTLVDFEAGGVGGEFLDAVGLEPLDGERLPGYRAWLPDRTVTLYREPHLWHRERDKLGATARHRAFWRLIDQLAEVYWTASRAGIRLPLRRPADLLHNARALGPRHLPLARYLGHTLGDCLHRHGLRDDPPLVGLLSMLVEDTVHSTVDRAPLINAALGVTMRGAGLTRHRGGMRGLWRRLVAHYRSLGGQLRTGCRVEHVTGSAGNYQVATARGTTRADQVVSALPAESTLRAAAATPLARRLRGYVARDAPDLAGAVTVFLGVPEEEVSGQSLTHHQLLQDYSCALGDGNNMFISVSAPGDGDSAPPGYRSVMISTHTELAPWAALSAERYAERKRAAGEHLVSLARRVYPRLAERPAVFEVGTPRTYARFTSRPGGAVGGARQCLGNSNQRAVPHDLGVPGFWLVGDSTWPGLGTVASAVASRIVADGVRRAAPRMAASRTRRSG
jgi:C-3',4' desaturase CrtD